MKPFETPENLMQFVDEYDKCDYKIWTSTSKAMEEYRSESKQYYIKEQRNTCFFCKVYIPSNHGLHWQVEHILPRSLFPQFVFEPKNLVGICPDCNGAKGQQNPHIEGDAACGRPRYPSKSGRFLTIHPLYDIYEDHLRIQPANHPAYPKHHFVIPIDKSSKGLKTYHMYGLERFILQFGGMAEMSGPDVVKMDKVIDFDFSKLTQEEKMALAAKILQS